MAKVQNATSISMVDQTQQAIARVQNLLMRGGADPLWRYLVEHGHTRVQGWVTEGALSAAVCFAGYQSAQGVNGSVIEIGVHHGRYFIALAASVPEGTTCVAIDCFENQDANIDHSGRGDSQIFKQNVSEWLGETRALRILQADSLSLSAKIILGVANGNRARLFSIDGGHTANHLINDLRLAEHSIASEGLIIIDDFFNSIWPGVTEGVYRYFDRRLGGLEPVAYGDNKLYMAHPDAAEKYRTFVTRGLVPRALANKLVEIGGVKVFHIRLPRTSTWIPRPAEKYGSIRQMMGRGARPLVFGAWHPSEVGGRWTASERAGIIMKAPPVDGELCLIARIGGMVGSGETTTLRILVEGVEVASGRLENEGRVIELIGIIPAPALTDRLCVEFMTNLAASPESLGLSGDKRFLGVYVVEVSLFPKNVSHGQPMNVEAKLSAPAQSAHSSANL